MENINKTISSLYIDLYKNYINVLDRLTKLNINFSVDDAVFLPLDDSITIQIISICDGIITYQYLDDKVVRTRKIINMSKDEIFNLIEVLQFEFNDICSKKI